MKLLSVSNGKTEDALAVRVLQEVQRLEPSLEISALSLVGRGLAYERAGYPVLGPRQESPSDGFMMQSLENFMADLRAGFISMTLEQFRALRGAKPDIAFVCGDVYALAITLAFTRHKNKRPKLFQLQPLVSLYYQDGMTLEERLKRLHRTAVDTFVLPERLMMGQAERVFVRDERSAEYLRRSGLPEVVSYGNVMMDQVVGKEVDLSSLRDSRPLLVLLPGSRTDYVFSFPKMLEAVQPLSEFQTFAAFAGSLDRISLPAGWSWTDPSEKEHAASAERVACHETARVPVLRKAFASCLHEARVVLGTAGTANEQAAGLGIPVISFPTLGPQFTEGFAKAQQRLLGEAVRLEPPDPTRLALAIRQAHENERLREAVLRAGRERIGEPGAAQKIARDMLEHSCLSVNTAALNPQRSIAHAFRGRPS